MRGSIKLIAVSYLLFIAGFILLLFLASFFLRGIVWHLRYPFMWLNYLLWVIHDPFRWIYRDISTGRGRIIFFGLNFGFLHYLYFFVVHWATLPFRMINTVYFNFVLLWPISLYDNLSELFDPKRRKMRHAKGNEYKKRWILEFPRRFLEAFSKSVGVMFSSILMAPVEIFFPVYTMFHGTDFQRAGADITQGGRWLVGRGDHAGSGVYFGIVRKTAIHYSNSQDTAILLCRVCLTPMRSAGTLKKDQRSLFGRDGKKISEQVGALYKSIEHWRVDKSWFEYCLLQPKKADSKVSLWRARPIAIEKDGKISRVWGGSAAWCGGARGIGVALACWILLLLFTQR